MRVLVRQDRSIDPAWRPEQGDFFDAVVAALEFVGVPAVIIEQERRATRGVRRMLRCTVAGRATCEIAGSCEGCGADLWPASYCEVCDACAECCSCPEPPGYERPPCLVCGEYAPAHVPGCAVGPACPERIGGE
jgi:hypothetical protein